MGTQAQTPGPTAVPAVVERLTSLYGPASLPKALFPNSQKDPLGHLLSLQRRNWSQAWISSTFYDWRTVSKYRRNAGLHLGYDIALPYGTEVSNGWTGVVTAVIPWTSSEYGVPVATPDGTEITYGHISPLVSVGQAVVAGQTIGRIAADHVDVKMRDAQGRYLAFGEGSSHKPLTAASFPKADRNSILTTWLVAKSAAGQAEEDLFLAQNAGKKWELEKRSAKRRMEALNRTLEQVESSKTEGLLSRKRLEELKAERSAAEATLKRVETRKASSTAQLEQRRKSSLAQLKAVAAWAKSEGLQWSDVEKLVQRTVSSDSQLKKQVAEASPSDLPLTLKQLDAKVKEGDAKLQQLEELYTLGGMSRAEIEDQRLRQELLREEYKLRVRRNYQP